MPVCCDTTSGTDIDLGIVNVESTARIELLMKDNGEIWDSIGSVELTLISPTGVFSDTLNMIAESGTANIGVWYYDLTEDDVTTTGRWRVSVKSIEGAVSIVYPYEITFEAVSQGG